MVKTDGSGTILPPLQCANEEPDVTPAGFAKVAIVILLHCRSHDHANPKANPTSLLGVACRDRRRRAGLTGYEQQGVGSKR